MNSDFTILNKLREVLQGMNLLQCYKMYVSQKLISMDSDCMELCKDVKQLIASFDDISDFVVCFFFFLVFFLYHLRFVGSNFFLLMSYAA